MKREEKTSILAALENAVNRCNELAEKADTFDEKQYQWGQADGYNNAAALIAARPES